MLKSNLYVKFNLLIVGSIFLCGILMGGIFLYSTAKSLREDLQITGQQTAEALGASISNDILLDNHFGIAENLLRVKAQNKSIRYIIVCCKDNKILASTFAEGLPKGLPVIRKADTPNAEGIDAQIYNSNESKIDEILYPIDGGTVGYIRIGMSEVEIENLLEERSIQIFTMVFLVCVLGSGLATQFAWRFLQPISEMSKAVGQIGKNNYDVQIKVKNNDEVGRLAKAFVKMVERLNKKDKENAYLLEELKEKEKKREWLISQLFTAREDERKRISRELHDETSQSMVSILAYLRVLKDKLTTEEQEKMLEGTRELTAMTLESLRTLAVNLHPPLLEDLGLIVAIEKYLDSCRVTNPNLTINYQAEGDFSNLDNALGIVCYRTLQEAMTNVFKHSQATVVDIHMIHVGGELAMIIHDNGIGFDEKVAEQARLNRHLGLVSMRERAELLNGCCEIESEVNKGTYITVVLPVTEEENKQEKDKEGE